MALPFFSKLLPIISGTFRLLKVVLSIVATIILVSTAAFITLYIYFARNLPDIRSLEDYHPPVISEVFADDGTKVGEFWTECRIYYPFDDIPKRVVQAFIASEDARFFEHKGVDVRSIMRAFIANVRAGGVKQGGSTITQQITRSLLLSRERTLNRKIKEAILATRLERRLDKKQIITLYLNQIFLGNRAYGVGAAARNYFHKKLEDLSLGQIALIAGLPTAPNSFSPINNPERARSRQIHVLQRMIDEGYITKDQMSKALAEKFEAYVAGIDKDFTDPGAAYFVEHVRRQVKEKYGDDVLYHKGLKIYTTMNVEMQSAAQRAIQSGVESVDHRRYPWTGPVAHVDPGQIDSESEKIRKEIMSDQHGVVISWPPGRTDIPVRKIKLDPDRVYAAIVTGKEGHDLNIRIGDVNGTIGPKGYQWTHKPLRSFDIGDMLIVRTGEEPNSFILTRTPKLQAALYSMDPHNGFVKAVVGGYNFEFSEFNRATQALRQPGSSFKPFVYAAALDKGYTYNSTIMDTPVVFRVGRRRLWSPKNYGGGTKGPTPFRNCLVFSRNIPTVKITFDIGMHYLTAFQRKMGISTPIDKYLSMALGANVVSLSEMISAYSVFVANGMYHKPVTITKIVDNKGKVIDEVSEEEAAKEQFPLSPSLTEDESEREQMSLVEEVDTEELSKPLYNNQKEWIVKDNLMLTEHDIKTLYGKRIPDGQVMTSQTAYLITKLLRDVVLGGTGTRLRALGKPVGGKTGTTNDETDAWFISIMPHLVSGVWVGFDEIKRIGYGATGGNTAAPIVLDYLKQVTKDLEVAEFEPPEGFPVGKIASLTGGSAVEGERAMMAFPGEFTGGDMAGEFFEQDMEFSGMPQGESSGGSSSYSSQPYTPPSPPPPRRDSTRTYPDF
jgi:penicillin-binding protein 1A